MTELQVNIPRRAERLDCCVCQEGRCLHPSQHLCHLTTSSATAHSLARPLAGVVVIQTQPDMLLQVGSHFFYFKILVSLLGCTF